MTDAVVSAQAPAAFRFRLGVAALLAAPAVFIAVLSVVPAILMIQLSFAHREPGGLWSPGFELTQYAQLIDPLFARVATFSILLAAFAAVITITLALPTAYFISRMRRRAQVAWLVCLLGALSLSEVLVVFAFQVLLSGGGGLVKALVALGLMASPHSLYPNFWAVLTCLVYLMLPYIILFLYPAVSKLEDDIPAAASTMGAAPLRTFLTVTTPMLKAPLMSAGLLVVIFTAGSYLTPLVLGRPQHWTIGIHISNAAMGTGNLPLAAAQAIVLVALMAGLLGLTTLLSRPRRRAA